MSVTQTPTAAPVTAGIDWAKDDHVMVIVGSQGEVVQRLDIHHDAPSIRGMVKALFRAGATDVGIERPDGPVVDALLDAGLTVFVIPPGQIKNLRSRYGSAGNKDDRFDAYVLADVVRTDRRRLKAFERDTQATTALRAAVRARKDLVIHRVAAANQLRAHLQIVFPGAVGLFADIDSSISLRFLARFTTQDQGDWLSVKRLENWLRAVGYSGGTTPEVLHQRLSVAARGLAGEHASAQAGVTRAYLAVLGMLNTQIQALADQITEQLRIHPDGFIFTSLPRSGTVRAARLLAEIGDARGRFPTPESLACLAGVAPSTRQSGKVKSVTFRWSADKQLRDAVIDFAGDSRHANPWAADVYQRAIDRGHDHPHAVRILARAWLNIIWRCWQNNTAYQPELHGALQTLQNQQDQAAA